VWSGRGLVLAINSRGFRVACMGLVLCCYPLWQTTLVLSVGELASQAVKTECSERASRPLVISVINDIVDYYG